MMTLLGTRNSLPTNTFGSFGDGKSDVLVLPGLDLDDLALRGRDSGAGSHRFARPVALGWGSLGHGASKSSSRRGRRASGGEGSLGSFRGPATPKCPGAAGLVRWRNRGELGGASVWTKEFFTIGYGGSATRHERDEEEERIYGKIAILCFSRGQRKKTRAAARSGAACSAARARQLRRNLYGAARQQDATTRLHHVFRPHEEALLGDSSGAARRQRGGSKLKCSIRTSWLLGRTPLSCVSVLCLHKAARAARAAESLFPFQNLSKRIGG